MGTMVADKNVKELEGSRAELTITIDSASIEKDYSEKLAKYAKEVQIDGFRKGKVPVSVLERKFGDAIREESTFKTMEEGLEEALKDIPEDQKPIAFSTPELQNEESLLPFKKGEDITFSVIYDIYPKFDLPQYTGLTAEVPAVEITDKDIDDKIEELRDRGMSDFSLSDLEEIYPAASARSKAKDESGELTPDAEDFRKRALAATARLQDGDPECRKVWEHIMELSLADLRRNYDALNVSFELWKGESDAQKYILDMLRDMEERGIAHESQGALVVDIAEEGDTKEYPPCLIRKSDGASLYATTDLATMVEREQLYHPDAYIYIADQRQSLHYLSFFRVARKAGIVSDSEKLTFLGFGTMNGKDGKPFKTREGGVMRLSVLIDEINEKVFERIRGSRSEEEISDEEAREIARIVGLSALKYGDLSNQASKDYIFDIDRFTSFEGNTGPYILYTIVRIGSILEKYREAGGHLPKAEEMSSHTEGYRKAMEACDAGKKLGLSISRYAEVIGSAWEETAPHKICQYIYEISNEFNSFYHDVKILSEPDEEKKKSYLLLLGLTRRILQSCIDMLGFSAPDKM